MDWDRVGRSLPQLLTATGVLRPELETFYIDIGLDDERYLAQRDLAEGRRMREYQDWADRHVAPLLYGFGPILIVPHSRWPAQRQAAE